MKRVVSFLFIIVISLVGVLFYLANYRPNTLSDLLIQVDVFGVTRLAEAEQDRLARISALGDAVHYEEKQALIQHTVFMGATEEMVKLALGEPPKTVEHHKIENGIKSDDVHYIYYLSDDKRPTVLVFQENKLINAYKGSNIDEDAK